MKKRNESGWYRVSKAFLEFQGAFYFGRRIRQRKEETNMKELTGNQVRQMFLDYFQSKGQDVYKRQAISFARLRPMRCGIHCFR